MSDDSQPHATESVFTTTREFIDRVIEEMPVRVIAAIAFVTFFFFYGAAINVVKLTGADLAAIDFPFGVVSGVVGMLAVSAYIIVTKVRRRRLNRDQQANRGISRQEPACRR